jgi:2',3'-cyclic-nucleotide 2'-phosphodiesterase (5'-nucleotidase family)
MTDLEGSMVVMDSTWDAHPDSAAIALLAPYQAKIDSVMYRVVGTAAHTMDKGRPESELSNLVADVLRHAAQPSTGKVADVGVVNMGGLRTILSAGSIDVREIYEILPFENSLCILTFKGTVLKQVLTEIAACGGEGVSGVRLLITSDGKLLQATVGGKPVDDNKLYTLATIDYIADGNDGMPSMAKAAQRICPEHSILRDLFIRYVEAQTARGKQIVSQLEGRITIAKNEE